MASGAEDTVPAVLERVLEQSDAYRDVITRIREEHLAHFGAAGEPIAEALVALTGQSRPRS